MNVARSRAELFKARETLQAPVVLVPTMGALHDGHRALLRRARELAGRDGSVAVSIFVNPLQFGPNEDLDKYPRTLDADLEACRAEGADLVFAPDVAAMYPEEQAVTVDPGPAGEILEGEFRPGFFRGVLTVVTKLFSLVRPDIAVFGAKDAQQLVLVRRMTADLALGIEIEAVPIVRAADGLALSSRNKYLSPRERAVAPLLYQALSAGAAAAGDGPQAVLDAAGRVLSSETGLVSVDYLALVDARNFALVKPADSSGNEFPSTGFPSTGFPSTGFPSTGILAIAARVGESRTRLIDNVVVEFGTEPHAADD